MASGLDLLAREEGVLGRDLLAPAPARVAVRVDVGRPEVEPRATGIAEGPGLGADDLGHGSDQGHVEGRAHGDGLRERRRVAEVAAAAEAHTGRARHPVQRLLPPLVGR